MMAREEGRITPELNQYSDRVDYIGSMVEQDRVTELYPDESDPQAAKFRADAEMYDLMEKIRPMQDALDGIKAIHDRIAAPGPAVYLLKFSTEGRGRAVVAINNPDTADNVITYVPGTFAKLGEGTATDIERSHKMVADAGLAAPSKKTSSITWEGYDAPQSLIPGAAESGFADDAAPDLRRFQTGLRASTHAHLTVLGHSYGTTVVGFTARDTAGIQADDIVFVASPGVGVAYAVQLNGVPLGHVWATTAVFDIIRIVPDVRYGYSPVDPQFGAHQFTMDWNPLDGHTTYWDGTYDDNPARRGIAAIATSKYSSVQ